MDQRRSVAFVTGTRAEYGIARWILHDIVASPSMDLKLIVTGTHLSESHGHTIDEILGDGFEVNRKLPLSLGDDSPAATALWMSQCLQGVTSALLDLSPDILLLVGDRFEMLVAAQAAMLARVPVAHLHGGEVTAGSLDDGMRHAITKLAHTHLTAAEEYARRIIQLGEQPSAVHVVGAPGLCALDRDSPLEPTDVASVLGFPTTEPYVMVTFHPVSAKGSASSISEVKALVSALARFPDLRVVITGVNVDPGFSSVREILQDFTRANAQRVMMVESLGHRMYVAALRTARACIGNSSSGIIEAPAMGVPTVNIGDRQSGRLRAASVIDCQGEVDAIVAGIVQALDPQFIQVARKQHPPYGAVGASRRVVDVLEQLDLGETSAKEFRDCGHGCNSWVQAKGVVNRA